MTVNLQVVEPHFELMTEPEEFVFIMRKLEKAGRTCYKSESAMHADSADDFIDKIVKSGHESVIEHAVITGRCVGTRSMSHQLVRHRIGAHSQESQRYCDYGKKGLQICVPPAVGDALVGAYTLEDDGCWRYESPHCGLVLLEDVVRDPDTLVRIFRYLQSASSAYTDYLWFREHGIKPEDAREALQNMTKTEVVTTFNLRTWRHVFRERALNPKAQWQIKKIMLEALASMTPHLPVIFGDLQAQVG